MENSFANIVLDILYRAAPGVIGTGFVALVVYLYKTTTNHLRIKRSSYSGVWYGSIFDDAGKIKKADKFVVAESRRIASGDIFRMIPHSETERSWSFRGRIQNHSFLASYWSDDERNLSSGIWLLKQTSHHVFSGYYYRLEEANNHSPRRIGAFRMILRKDKELSEAEAAEYLDQIPEMNIHVEASAAVAAIPSKPARHSR